MEVLRCACLLAAQLPTLPFPHPLLCGRTAPARLPCLHYCLRLPARTRAELARLRAACLPASSRLASHWRKSSERFFGLFAGCKRIGSAHLFRLSRTVLADVAYGPALRNDRLDLSTDPPTQLSTPLTGTSSPSDTYLPTIPLPLPISCDGRALPMAAASQRSAQGARARTGGGGGHNANKVADVPERSSETPRAKKPKTSGRTHVGSWKDSSGCGFFGQRTRAQTMPLKPALPLCSSGGAKPFRNGALHVTVLTDGMAEVVDVHSSTVRCGVLHFGRVCASSSHCQSC